MERIQCVTFVFYCLIQENILRNGKLNLSNIVEEVEEKQKRFNYATRSPLRALEFYTKKNLGTATQLVTAIKAQPGQIY